MIFLIIICFIIIGFLAYKLIVKNNIDVSALEDYKAELAQLRGDITKSTETLRTYESELLDITIKCNTERNHLETAREQLDECEKQLKLARDAYDKLVVNKTEEINNLMDEQRKRRQKELEQSFETEKNLYTEKLNNFINECTDKQNKMLAEVTLTYDESQERIHNIEEETKFQETRFNGLLEPLKQYEKEKSEKLFYVIQLPDEYHDDIEFLLTTVAAKVQHPDIIAKLVWAEYVKPNLDDTFKRIEIKPEPGIYKLTNIDSGKAYIGKSTNVKTRIADHFKSSIGLSTISDQAVHHEIRKTGFWNWAIEVIIYCEKDKLSELEKYYIDFFKTQEFGFNKRAGG